MLAILTTADNSNTIYIPELDETYHSRFGAVQESRHVFVESGFQFVSVGRNDIRILEIGFGTGLNAILTLLAAKENDVTLHYHGIENYPLDKDTMVSLGYERWIPEDIIPVWGKMHRCEWNQSVEIKPGFDLLKQNIFLQDFTPDKKYNLIYFDAFSPDKQPELWTSEIFKILFDCLEPGGVLVTYSSKGIVKQNLRSAGFNVERIRGPVGKRHILRAVKTIDHS